MLGMGTGTATQRKRKPDYDIGQHVSFSVYFGYGCTEMFGEIAEHIGPREYIAQCSNGARFIVRVGKDMSLSSGGPN